MTKNIFSIILILILAFGAASAQEKKGSFLFKAMQDELDRNMKELSLPGMERPFFIAYTIVEGKRLKLDASLGSIKDIYESPFIRTTNAEVLVGNYHRTNKMGYESSLLANDNTTPIITTTDNNYDQLRRDLWRQTDIAYKSAAQDYSKKMAILKQKNLSQEELDMDDYAKVKPVEKIIPSNNIIIDKIKISHLVEELSAIFKDYPDIDNSEVSAVFSTNDVYCVNSEGSKYSFPNNLITIKISVQGRSNGKTITDNMGVSALQDKDLPSLDELKTKINVFAKRFVEMKKAPAIKEYYSGPVLFEGDAAAKLFERELFTTSGLYANRERVEGGGTTTTTLQEKMNCNVISNEYTVKCLPFLKEYDGEKLTGQFDIDLEGNVPERELTLIENGMLKNVIGNRIISKYNKAPSGYYRSGVTPTQFQKILSPGVVDISTSRGVSKDSLKQLLLKTARENGYKYAYIVRKLVVTQIWFDTYYYPTYLYRVNVTDGSEELIQDAELRDFRQGLLKLVMGTSNKKTVVNTMSAYDLVPITYICPDAVLLPSLEIAWKKDMQKTPPPIVNNPLKD